MRSIKELLQIMLDNQKSFNWGLCGWAGDLWLHYDLFTNEEYGLILNYIANNRPSKFSSIDAFKYRERLFYWTAGDINPRIKWLKKTY